MAQSRSRVCRLLVVVAVAVATTYATGVTVPQAVADVTAVSGRAFGYQASISLFGGPATVRGFGQPADAPATNASPAVTLPATGSANPITATDSDGATAEYGPAKIFSGKYPADPNAAAPPSGPITVSTQGTLGPNGSVTSSVSITQPRGVGPGPVTADEVRSTCTASESGKSASTTITGGVLETKYDASTQLPTVTEPIPTNPSVNFTRTGTLDHIGDSYRVVFNEQINNGDGSITVNAVHMFLLGPTAVGELIIGQSACGVTATAATTSTTQAGATTTQAGATTTTQAGATTTTQAGATTTTQAGATTTTQASATTTTQAGATTTTAASGNTTTTAAGGGGSVSGAACGYFASVGLFGGPQNVRGCGQPSGAPATNASPSVTLPAAGSTEPITGTDPDGAMAEYGPARIFSGQYPSSDANAVAPPSGPLSVSTQGVPGGTVTSSAEVGTPRGVGPGPVIADAVRSTCSASASGVSGSTTITGGKLETKYDTSTQLATTTEDIPANPGVNFTRTGTLDHIGDSFRVVYNEQITEGDSITVNAVHMFLLGPTAVGELVIGQSKCGLSAGSGGGSGSGGGTASAAGSGVARTGTNALRLVAFAMLLVAAGAHVRHWAPQFEWYETTSTVRRRQFPRRAVQSRRLPRRPWD
jgi:hypothetical protein